jgi:hypothetical protein
MDNHFENDWQPISREQLDRLLSREEAQLTPDVREIYEGRRSAIAEHPCFRSEQYGIERVFVVARSGKLLLFFDDSEDEFAVGVPDDDGILRDWGLYGSLTDAVRCPGF